MKRFEITERGAFVGGVELEVGAVVEHDELPVTLVGKAREVKREQQLEVATPRKPGRPSKQ